MNADDNTARMFDAPGPRGRRRSMALSVVAGIAILGAVAYAATLFAESGGFEGEKWAFFTQGPIIDRYLDALWNTVRVALVAGVIGLVYGAVLAVGSLSRSRIVSAVCRTLIEVTRALPTLLVLYFLLLYLPYSGIRISLFWMLTIGMSITNGGMIGAIIRSCMLAVPRGQTDATLALGMTYSRTLRLIVFPQGFAAAMPALVTQLVYLFKTSTLGYVVSYSELLFETRILAEFSGHLIQAFLIVCVIFIVINEVLSRVAFFLHKKYAKNYRSASISTEMDPTYG